MLKLDAQSSGYFVNRYLVYNSFTKYEEKFSYKRVGKKYQRYQKVKYTEEHYKLQWLNIKHDLIGVFKNPVRFIPHIAYNLAAFLFLNDHETARAIAFALPIASDATSVGQTASTDPLNITHTCTGSNRVLYCMFGDNNAGPSSPTYASTAMTQIIRSIVTREAVIFRLIAPATGANTLAITGGTNSDVVSGNVSFTGADQSQTGIASTTGTGTLSLTTVFDDAFIVQVTAHNAAETADSGQTVIQNATQGVITSISAYKSFPGAAGSKAMNINAAQDNALVEVKAAAGFARSRMMVGIGI